MSAGQCEVHRLSLECMWAATTHQLIQVSTVLEFVALGLKGRTKPEAPPETTSI